MATNGIKKIAVSASAADILSQVEFEALSDIDAGLPTGILQRRKLNKILRQTSTIAAAVAQSIVDNGDDVTDDMTPSVIANLLKAAILSGAGSATGLAADLADSAVGKGSDLVTVHDGAAGATPRNVRQWLNDAPVSILRFGADRTGSSLCNAALDAAKAVCKTVLLPPGVYRFENYTLEDVRIIGCNADGANYGLADVSTIHGSGDIFVNANNFSLDSLTIKNTSAGAAGKLISIKDIDTSIGPIRNCRFLRANYHIYHSSTTKTIVGAAISGCLFREALIYSRYYENMGLFQYSEFDCYTQQNKRGLFIQSASTALIAASVFEFHDEGAVYINNTTVSSDVIRGLKFEGIHFEQNGNATPTADVTINVAPSLGRVSFDSCSFLASTVAGNVNLSNSPSLRIIEQNCKDISYTGQSNGCVITIIGPKQPGRSNGLAVVGGDIETTGKIIAHGGVAALSSLTVTIYGTVTATPVLLPDANTATLVVVRDATSGGSALLLLSTSAVIVVTTTITSVTFTASSGHLQGQTTGGSSFRVLYFLSLST